MLPEVSTIQPQCFEEFLSQSFWWNEYARVIGVGFSRARAGELHAKGLQRVRHTWHHEQIRFMTAEEIDDHFELLPEEFGAWDAAVAVFTNQWNRFLCGHAPDLVEYEYAGIYLDPEDPLPTYVLKF